MADSTRTELATHARQFETTLREGILPYWRRTAIDPRFGGYRLRDFGSTRFARLHRWRARQHAGKHLMGQSRILWTFAHAHSAGIDDDGANLDAARRGITFLVDHFLDREHGGWIWETTRDGSVVDDRKSLCGQFMVVLALVEYARASGDDVALEHARTTYDTIEARLRDNTNGGWIEGATRDWQTLDPSGRRMVGAIGVKSDNVYLHVMEALAELAEITGDSGVRASLAESIDLTRANFFPDDPTRWARELNLDWSPVDEPAIRFSYGHAVEFAWLLLRADEVLDRVPSWDFFFRTLDRTLEGSWDKERGGIYEYATLDGLVTDDHKSWWAQAEMMAALTDAAVARPGDRYDALLLQLAEFIAAYFPDPRDGVWIDTVSADGTVLLPGKAHDWIGGYHDTRALVKFCRAFGQLGTRPSDVTGRG